MTVGVIDFDFLDRAGLLPAPRAVLAAVDRAFPVLLTPDVLAAITGPNRSAAIAAQFLPSPRELTIAEHERTDPIGDRRWSPLPGLVHRYPDRVLLKLTSACLVHCRFCFRRDLLADEASDMTTTGLAAALDYIRANDQIWEVVLTGGDPLTLGSGKLGRVLTALDQIGHVEVLRLHSRVPVVAPERITADLIGQLCRRAAVYLVVHANHADELTPGVATAVAGLASAGVGLLSQTVLLRGVNDSVEALTRLMRRLVAIGIKPYYLHHLDPARGTGHFHVSLAEGQRLVAALRGRVSGLCQPSYVLDIPGGYGKVPVGPVYLEPDTGDGVRRVTDFQGGVHEVKA
ncbi:lysine 2,3-aminomutase [uncultured Gammaproteobacteria bacterium]